MTIVDESLGETTEVSKSIALHNRAAQLANKNIGKINSKSQYKGKDFNKDSLLRKKYIKDHHDNFMNGLDRAVIEAGTDASETKNYKLFEQDDHWEIHEVSIKHSMFDKEGFKVNIEYDKFGHIVELITATPAASVEHGEHATLSVLEHHGTKGMKWGVRRGRGGLSKSEFRKKIAKGGHESKRNSKKSEATNKLKSMSDDQLRESINRIHMEKQFKALTNSGSKSEKAAKFIGEIAANSVKTAVTAAATKQIAKAIAKKLK